ncbi:ankyrin repeat-containing domain protein [Chytriomyces sp. MP71]|nr:ankyrin repeat-containing domain protein [Chytriomyces sp. MP71]
MRTRSGSQSLVGSLSPDALAAILARLPLSSLQLFAEASRVTRRMVATLQNSLWFAKVHLTNLMLEIVCREAGPPYAEITAWNQLRQIDFSTLPVCYTVALIQTLGFNMKSLAVLYPEDFNSFIFDKPHWRQSSIAKSKHTSRVSRAIRKIWPHFKTDLAIVSEGSSPMTGIDTLFGPLQNDASTLLLWSCAAGNIDVTSNVLNSFWNTTFESHSLALAVAASYGHQTLLELMISHFKFDPSASGHVALQWACKNGELGAVQLLLADENVRPDAVSNLALLAAARHGHMSVMKRLMQDARVDPGAQESAALVAAARHGHARIVDALIHDGRAKLNAQEGNALSYATLHGHLEIIELLLAAGADASLNDFKCLHYSVMTRNTTLVKLFFKYGGTVVKRQLVWLIVQNAHLFTLFDASHMICAALYY